MTCADCAPASLLCPYCGGLCTQQEMTLTLRSAQSTFVLVKNVPGDVCETCGEAQFSLQTTAQILAAMQSERRPDGLAMIPVYDLACL